MKKNVTKVILLVLSLAILVGSAIGISVSASDSAPEIISKNVKTNGNFCLMFAVDPATVVGDDVTIKIYDRDPSLEGAVIVETLTKSKSDVQYEALDGDGIKDDAVIVFETSGVAAKDIADVWYITAESAGNVSEVMTYSVMEYAFQRLYKDGTVNAVEADGKKYLQQQFYLEILDMGSAAQALQVNYGSENPERLAKEYTYVTVKGGSYSDGIKAGFAEVGAALTLAADDPAVTGWNVTVYGQNGGLISTQTLAIGDTLTVSGNTVVVPYIAGVTPGLYFKEIGNPKYTMDNLNWKDLVGGTNGTNLFAHSSFSSGTNSYTHEKLDDGNWVLKLMKNPAETTDSTNYKNRTQTMFHYPVVTNSDEANCVVTEFDFRYTNDEITFESDATNTEMKTNVFVFAWSDDDFMTTNGIAYNDWTSSTGVLHKGLSKNVLANLLSIDYDGDVDEKRIGGDALRLPSSNGKKVDLLPDTWYNICIEIYTDANKMLWYVDGTLVSVYNISNSHTIDEFNTFTIMIDGRFWRCEMWIDNMFNGKIAKEYVAP